MPQEIVFNNAFFSALIKAVMISSVLLINIDDLNKILDSIFGIIAIFCFIGLLFHILRLFNIYAVSPFTEIITDDGRIYNIYLFHISEVSRYSFVELSTKFQSIFDEPGYLGTIVGLYLIIKNYELSRFKNQILLVAGAFTFSLAFYLMTALFYLFSPSIKNKIKSFIVILIIVVIAINFIPNFGENIISRFYTQSDMNYWGDSRGGMIAARVSWQIITKQDFINVLFGNGWDSIRSFSEDMYVGSSSIWRLIYQIGFMFLLYFLVLILIFSKKYYHNLLFTFVFILSLYQRPQIFEVIFILIFTVGCLYRIPPVLKESKTKRKYLYLFGKNKQYST